MTEGLTNPQGQNAGQVQGQNAQNSQDQNAQINPNSFLQMTNFMNSQFDVIKQSDPILKDINNYNDLILKYKTAQEIIKNSVPIVPKTKEEYVIDTKGLQVSDEWIEGIRDASLKNKLTKEQAQLLAERDINNYHRYINEMKKIEEQGWTKLREEWGVNFEKNKQEIEGSFFKKFIVPENMKTPEHYRLYNEIKKLISNDTLNTQSSMDNTNKSYDITKLSKWTYQ